MPTTFHIPVNDASSHVAAPRAVGAPIVVAAGTGPRFGTSFPILLTAARGAAVVAEFEATGRTGDTLTVSGPVEGSADVALLVGDLVECRPTALALAEIHSAVHALESAPGGVAIGTPIASGTAGRVLLEGAGPVVADSAGLTFDVATNALTVGDSTLARDAAIVLANDPAHNPVISWASGTGDTGLLFKSSGTVVARLQDNGFLLATDLGTLSGFQLHGDYSIERVGAQVLAFDFPAAAFDFRAGGGNTWTTWALFSPNMPSTSGVTIRGASGQTAPLLPLQGRSSTATARDLGYIDAGFTISTDATHAGYVDIDAADHAGRRKGIRVASDGTQVLHGFFGAEPVAKAASPTTLADVITIIRNLGFSS